MALSRPDGGAARRPATNLLNPTIKGVSPTGAKTVLKPPGTNTVLKPAGATSRPFSPPPPAPAPRRSAPPAQSFDNSLGGDSGGGGGGSLGGGFAEPPAPSVEQYQAQDAILAAALGALDRAMADYNAQYDADLSNYDRDFNQGLGNLGWKDQDAGDPVSMGWDWNDLLTSSGKAFQSQRNDFANRGMLQSQGYADALALLERSLNDQKGAMDTARNDFRSDKARGKTEFGNQDTLSRQQARAESTSRRAAQYGIV